MSSKKRLTWFGLLLALALVAVAAMLAPMTSSSGLAVGRPPDEPSVVSLTILSQEPALDASCSGVNGADARSEAEVSMAVDPADADHVLAAWHQGQFTSGGALAIGYAVTFDGGGSWHRGIVPGFTRCDGQGEWDRVGDPFVSIGPGGVVYVTAAVAPPAPPGVDVLGERVGLVVASPDGGRTWEPPLEIYRSAVPGSLVTRPDGPKPVADPGQPGRLYSMHSTRSAISALWTVEFMRSDDGGRTWTTPVTAHVPLPGRWTGTFSGPQVLPNGDLVAIVWDMEATIVLPHAASDSTKRVSLTAVRSTDGGQTWRGFPIVQDVPSRARDPERQERAILGCWACNLAVAPDGTLWTAMPRIVRDPATLATASSTLLASSGDGGRTWTVRDLHPLRPGITHMPHVEVTSSGMVGVIYLDSRNDVRGDRAFTADLWASWSRDGGATWSEHHVHGPFDVARYPVWGVNLMPGDYWAVVRLGAGHLGFAFTVPGAAGEPTDVLFAKLSDGSLRARPCLETVAGRAHCR